VFKDHYANKGSVQPGLATQTPNAHEFAMFTGRVLDKGVLDPWSASVISTYYGPNEMDVVYVNSAQNPVQWVDLSSKPGKKEARRAA